MMRSLEAGFAPDNAEGAQEQYAQCIPPAAMAKVKILTVWWYSLLQMTANLSLAPNIVSTAEWLRYRSL
jgi:hypothetical protein